MSSVQSSKKRRYPFYDSEEAGQIIVQQSFKKMKIQQDLSNIISKIAQQIESGQIERIPKERSILKGAQKIYKEKLLRRKQQLLPYQIQKILQLRFGRINDESVKNLKPLNTYKQIALKVGARIHQVYWHVKQYIQRGYKLRDGPRDFSYKKPILHDKNVVDFLLDKNTLRLWASHSLQSRCKMIKDKFNITLNHRTLSNFYRKNRVSYTKMKKVFANKEHLRIIHIQRMLFINETVNHFLNEKEIIFFDEASTHLWEFQSRIWQSMDNPLRIPIAKSRGTGLQILGALSSKENHFYYSILNEGSSICNETIKDFFVSLNAKKSLRNCIIILDRHPAHQTYTTGVLESLDAIALKLPVNSSIFNPVEYCWGYMKSKLRKQLLDEDQDSLLKADRNWLQMKVSNILDNIPQNILEKFNQYAFKTMKLFLDEPIPEEQVEGEKRFL